jgi:transcriptional regulator with XRE-family HTH domain
MMYKRASNMSYAIQQLGHTLKAAREAKGLSQRALSEKAGVPQSHISRIENGAVDLRVSSLVQLGRALDLELMLVPRKVTSAVWSMVRTSAHVATPADGTARQTLKELKRLQDRVAELTQLHPAVTELAQLQRQIRELQHFRIPRHDLAVIRNAAAAVKSFQDTAANVNVIREAYAQLAALRSALAHGISASAERESVRPAYSLDEDDHG